MTPLVNRSEEGATQVAETTGSASLHYLLVTTVRQHSRTVQLVSCSAALQTHSKWLRELSLPLVMQAVMLQVMLKYLVVHTQKGT